MATLHETRAILGIQLFSAVLGFVMLSENEQLNSPNVCQDVNANAILIIDNEQLNSPTECQHVYANVILIITNEQLYSPTEFM